MTPELAIWLTLDFAAKRYGVLPSKLIETGDTVDLHCAEIAVGFERWVVENPDKTNQHNLTQDEMLKMMQRVRGANK